MVVQAINKFLSNRPFVIMKLKFSKPDSEIVIGQYIVIYEEILAQKTGAYTYKVWTDLTPTEVQDLSTAYDNYFKQLEEIIEREQSREEQLFKALADSINYVDRGQDFEARPKYKWTPKGMKRNRPWE